MSSRSRKRGRLTKKERIAIVKQLKEADLETIEELVIRGVEKEQHMHCFADRKSFWCYLIGNNGPAFRQLLQDGLFHFCSIYEGCSKGSERILRLMIEWNSFCAKYAVSSLSTGARWEQLTRGYCSTISEDCRSSVMSAVFATLYTVIVKQRDFILESMQTQCASAIQQAESMSVVPDDDVSLYRLFGFSLHASCKFRSRSCWSRSRVSKRYTILKKRNLRKQLSVLKLLIEEDKSVIPAILSKQDRGRMKFPTQKFLPFCRKCSVQIKGTLNLSSLLKDGRKISKVCEYMYLVC